MRRRSTQFWRSRRSRTGRSLVVKASTAAPMRSKVSASSSAERVDDWSGGTRIGASLEQFNRDWARRTLRSSGVVIIVSDGWDRGDPALVRDDDGNLHIGLPIRFAEEPGRLDPRLPGQGQHTDEVIGAPKR